jgi:hypothetical protein
MDLNKMINDKLLPGVANTQVIENGKRLKITMKAHYTAWCLYALLFGQTFQSYARISERGGFSEGELDVFYPEWRNYIVDSK